MVDRSVPDRFLVAFSLAGEERAFVRRVAQAVEKRVGRSNVFLDEWFEHYIAGADAEESVATFRRLVDQDPSNTRWQHDLAEASRELGELLADRTRPDVAEAEGESAG